MMASLNGVDVAALRLQIPGYGLWWAHVDTTDEADLTAGDTTTLVLGGTECTCAIVAGGAVEGRGRYRLVSGRGTWGRTVAAKGYVDDGGVTVARLVADLASDAGEAIGAPPTTRRGPRYSRPKDAASLILSELAGREWWADLDGVVQFGARFAVEYLGDAPRTRVDPAGTIVEIPLEALDIQPGSVVDGQTVVDVDYILDSEGRLTARCYLEAGTTSRLVGALAKVFDALDPRRRFRSLYEYRVAQQSGERLDLQPVRTSSGLPDLRRVPVRFASGVSCTHTYGSLVVVAFLDGDPSRPAVIAGDAAGEPGWDPTALVLHGDGDAVALASKVEAELSTLKTAITSAAVLAGDGGATFKANILAALNLAPPSGPWPLPVGSTVVKVE